MPRSHCMFRYALQAVAREHKQRSFRGLLPGSRTSAAWVGRLWRFLFCISYWQTHSFVYWNPFSNWQQNSILHRHIKRQIISLTGGFQVIADLNAYHSFISSLKVPSTTSDFSNLKMLGHVFVVEDAKDLAQIVRDVTRYGGSYRPEVSTLRSFPMHYIHQIDVYK